MGTGREVGDRKSLVNLIFSISVARKSQLYVTKAHVYIILWPAFAYTCNLVS